MQDTSGCVPGTTLTFTNQTWTCDRPLSSYGTLPLKVVTSFTNSNTDFGVRLDAGCTGDGTDKVDLIVDVKGDGRTYGTGDDAIRIMNSSPGARDIQVTGHADCGERRAGAHQDGIHAIGGTKITFVDFTIGNHDAGTSTCQGAGGIVFYSGAGSTAPDDLRIVRGEYIGCNHGVNATQAENGAVMGASFRSGRTDGTDPVCSDYYGSPACTNLQNVQNAGVTCQRWNASSKRWEDE